MTGSQGWWELILPNNRQPGVVGTDHAQWQAENESVVLQWIGGTSPKSETGLQVSKW
jgi:hypothetical protein